MNKRKPLPTVDSMFRETFTSQDPLLKAKGEILLFLGLAGQVTTQEEFDAVMVKIVDPNQRDLVARKLIPLLAFEAQYTPQENRNEGIDDIRGFREGQEGLDDEESSRETN